MSHTQRNHYNALPVVRLSRADLTRRFADVIAQTQRYAVVYADMIGEGPGGWHSDQRYPKDAVNCMVWLQLVLSEVFGYGQEVSAKTLIMDRIRYFGGHVGFSLRKHYIDHWLAIEPEPLIKVDLTPFVRHSSIVSVIDPLVFLSRKQFPFPLYQMGRTTFHLNYIKQDEFLECAEILPSGYYAVFCLPSSKYLAWFAKLSGPMGLVHPLVLELSGEATTKRPRSLERALIHQASTAATIVFSEPLKSFLDRKKHEFMGFVIYEADANWHADAVAEPDEEVRRLLELEQTLPKGVLRTT